MVFTAAADVVVLPQQLFSRLFQAAKQIGRLGGALSERDQVLPMERLLLLLHVVVQVLVMAGLFHNRLIVRRLGCCLLTRFVTDYRPAVKMLSGSLFGRK